MAGLDGSEDTRMEKYFKATVPKRFLLKQSNHIFFIRIRKCIPYSNGPRKSLQSRFNPEKDEVWFERNVLGHNMLENMLKNMTRTAVIQPYFTISGRQWLLLYPQLTWKQDKSKQWLVIKAIQVSKVNAQGPPCISSSTSSVLTYFIHRKEKPHHQEPRSPQFRNKRAR